MSGIGPPLHADESAVTNCTFERMHAKCTPALFRALARNAASFSHHMPKHLSDPHTLTLSHVPLLRLA
jgi:hypothetical protein